MAGTMFLRMHLERGRYFDLFHVFVLMAVQKHGAIQPVSAALGSTYRKTAILIRHMNRIHGDVIDTSRGREGGAHLTPLGAELLALYLRIERDFHRHFAADMRFFLKLMGDETPKQCFMRSGQSAGAPDNEAARMFEAPEAEELSETDRSPAWLYFVFDSPDTGFGPERCALLEAVETYGMIAAVGEAIGYNHQTIKHHIKTINDELHDVIGILRGRAGGVYLTPRGKTFLTRYRALEPKVQAFFARDLLYVNRLVGSEAKTLPKPRYVLVQKPENFEPCETPGRVRKVRKVDKSKACAPDGSPPDTGLA